MWITRVFVAILFVSCILSSSAKRREPRPVVMWHGSGDHCCHEHSVGGVKKLIEDEVPGIYVVSVMIGKTFKEDFKNSQKGNVKAQVKLVCEKLKNHPKLRDGYNALGFSQGSQFLRAVAQKCPEPRMYNLISLGGQHQGVFGIPEGFKHEEFAKFFTEKTSIANNLLLQSIIVPLQYWHDPFNEDKYRSNNNFIADLNNEQGLNTSYKRNLLRLENFVLVKFLLDKMVIPLESQWFGFYTPGTTERITPLMESKLWKEDRLGLRELHETGRLHFLSVRGEHLQFSNDWFISNILDPYIR